jgi:hypothetical protein
MLYRSKTERVLCPLIFMATVSGTLDNISGGLTNSGTLTNDGGGTLDSNSLVALTNTGLLTNSGVLNNNSG